MKIRKQKLQGHERKALYIPKDKVLKRLHLDEARFSKLCVFRGIYPRMVDKLGKMTKGVATGYDTLFYDRRDLKKLYDDPLVDYERSLKLFNRKYKKHQNRKEFSHLNALDEHRPEFDVAKLLKMRYPSFKHALVDLEDALSHLYLFYNMPVNDLYTIEKQKKTKEFCDEFINWTSKTGSLTRAFLSIKGLYTEAVISGKSIIWCMPYLSIRDIPENISMTLMVYYLDFYLHYMEFVLYKLYKKSAMVYPPPTDSDLSEKFGPFMGMVNNENGFISEQSDHVNVERKFNGLLKGKSIYISNEVPLIHMALLLSTMGAKVHWNAQGSNKEILPESSSEIDIQITERDSIKTMKVGRLYVQPQWLVDSLNSRSLLDSDPYVIGKTCPPHESPFYKKMEEGYVSDVDQDRVALLTYRKRKLYKQLSEKQKKQQKEDAFVSADQ